MYKRHIIGKEGEEIATEFLENKGYKILDRNFLTRHGEIDIVAKDNEEYVFIEVKTRRNNEYGQPIDAIDKDKIKHLKSAISYYLYINKLENKFIRIDVIEVKYIKNKIYINHIKQAIN